MILSKKTAWIILISLFVFDNFFSYYAITRLDGREANLAIAQIVETYPVLYFVCIPLTILIMYGLMLFFRKLFLGVFTKYQIKDISVQSRIILTAFVIYWAIGNSLMNFIFLLGRRLSIPFWGLFSLVAIILASAYSLTTLRNYQKKKNIF